MAGRELRAHRGTGSTAHHTGAAGNALQEAQGTASPPSCAHRAWRRIRAWAAHRSAEASRAANPKEPNQKSAPSTDRSSCGMSLGFPSLCILLALLPTASFWVPGMLHPQLPAAYRGRAGSSLAPALLVLQTGTLHSRGTSPANQEKQCWRSPA